MNGLCTNATYLLNRMFLTALDVESIIENGKNSAEDGGSLGTISSKVDDFGGGAYNIVSKVGIWCGIIGLLIAGICLIFSDSSSRNEAKSRIIRTIGGIVLIVSAVGLIIWISGINLFGE